MPGVDPKRIVAGRGSRATTPPPPVNMSNMAIRRADAQDAVLLARLGADVQALHHRHRPDWFKPADVGRATAAYEMLLGDPAVAVFVFEEGDEPLGYVVTRLVHRPETPLTWPLKLLDIDQIGVNPAARRRGVGAALFRAVRLYADELGVDLVHLTTWEFNVDAQAFFSANGMKRAMWRMTDP